MATAKPTTDHDEIRKWVEARKGHPARVKATGRGKDPGILRIDFPGFSGEDTLEEIEWDEFFQWFDKNNLALILSDARGNRFNKLVARTSVTPAKKSSASAKKASSAKKSSSGRGAKSSSSKSSAGKASRSKKTSTSKKAAPAKKASASRSSAKTSAATKASSTKKTSSSKKSTSATKSPRRLVASTTQKAATPRKAAPSKKSSSKPSSSKKAAPKASGSSITTTDHDEIRKWVESRGGFPATVVGTESRGEDVGLLRIDYPGYSGADTLERIEWDDWFEKFDEEDLAFLYQKKRNSRFSKLVRR